jgi:hypothetical protein
VKALIICDPEETSDTLLETAVKRKKKIQIPATNREILYDEKK